MIDDRETNVESAKDHLARELTRVGVGNKSLSIACAIHAVVLAVLHEERRDSERLAAAAADHIAAAISILRNPCYDAKSNITHAIRRLEAAARGLLPPSEH